MRARAGVLVHRRARGGAERSAGAAIARDGGEWSEDEREGGGSGVEWSEEDAWRAFASSAHTKIWYRMRISKFFFLFFSSHEITHMRTRIEISKHRTFIINRWVYHS